MKTSGWIYHHKIPRTMDENIAWRKKLLKACDDPDVRKDVYAMAARDLLFYVNAFAFIYEPRDAAVMPFITYPFQDSLFADLNDAIGYAGIKAHDQVIEKSRDMGASWCCVTTFKWRWNFHPMQTFLLISRKEDLVEKKDDPKSLFWKFDFLVENDPVWLRPRIDKTMLHRKNLDNGSTVDGESTTSETSTGDRRTAVLADEFQLFPDNGRSFMAASRDVTRCRVFNFTAGPITSAAYQISRDPRFKKKRLHWSEHPVKAEGLEMRNGKFWSPWYQGECDRAANKQEIAIMLDIDWQGADYQYFDIEVLERVIREDVSDPLLIGELEYNADTLEPSGFVAKPNGSLRLWSLPGHDEKANESEGPYVAGADISLGTGATNSALIVAGAQRREQVAELVKSNMEPREFAKYCVAVCKYFRNARLAWEANGPGRLFGNTVWESGYRNVFFSENERSITPAVGDTPGWYSTKEKKIVLLGEFRSAMKDQALAIHSEQIIAECRNYIMTMTGDVVHTGSRASADPSGARDNHGDRVIAAGLCYRMMKLAAPADTKKAEHPWGSLAARRERRDERKRLALATYW